MNALIWGRLPTVRLSTHVRPFKQPFVRQPPLRQPPIVRYQSWRPRRGQQQQQQQQYQRFQQQPRSNLQSLLYQWVTSRTFYWQLGGFGTVCGAYYVTHVEEAPLTGRRRFMASFPSFVHRYLEGTGGMLTEAYKDRLLPPTDKRHQLAQRVLERLIPSSGQAEKKWKLYVIDDPNEMNAMALPGGEVVIFTGMMKILENEDRLAAVMAHEVAHVVARHSVENLSQQIYLMPLYLAAAVGVSAVLSDGGITISRMIFNLVINYPASRKIEAEADYIGLMMMAQSCYRPEAAVSVWERFQQLSVQRPPQFLSTHPSDKNREVQIRDWLPQAYDKYNMSDCAYTGRMFDEFGVRSGGMGSE
ncbi:MAG: hypothetical protein M1831_002226 [Alyxoria varia]|nr:MAG: hypothetical protein M1831_002226 [Alyxoria varia]